MIIDCPFYYVFPDDSTPPEPVTLDEEQTCACDCRCGYLTYESLIPFLDELQPMAERDPIKYVKFEMKIRQLIVEVSRLFDIDVGVKPGFFSTGHISVKTIHRNGRYLKVPPFVQGTLEVFHVNNTQVSNNLFGTQGEYVIFMPCIEHGRTCCRSGCWSNIDKCRRPIEWPETCYKIRAKWGTECPDDAIKLAVRQYIIQTLRMGDPVTIQQSGFTAERGFKTPDAWTRVVSDYRRKRNIHTRYGIS